MSIAALRARYVPEPCDACPDGLQYLISFDGQRLCRNCTHRFAELKGWAEIPAVFLEHRESRIAEAPLVEFKAHRTKKWERVGTVTQDPLTDWDKPEPEKPLELFEMKPVPKPPKEQKEKKSRRKSA